MASVELAETSARVTERSAVEFIVIVLPTVPRVMPVPAARVTAPVRALKEVTPPAVTVTNPLPS